MLDPPTEDVLRDALRLPEEQQFALIDALLIGPGDDGATESEADARPLRDGRLRELAQLGMDDLQAGRYKEFSSPVELSNYVAGIFKQARDATPES